MDRPILSKGRIFRIIFTHFLIFESRARYAKAFLVNMQNKNNPTNCFFRYGGKSKKFYFVPISPTISQPKCNTLLRQPPFFNWMLALN